MSDAMVEYEADIVTKSSHRSVADTVSYLTDLVGDRRLKLFAVIDQSTEARSIGLELRDTVLVIFGSPAAGTPVMVAAPLAALDLPLKVLIWANGAKTNISYYAPRSLAARHNLGPDLARNLEGIDALTDLLVSP